MVHIQLRGEVFQFLTASSVFSKRRVDPGTRLLIEAMELPERGTLLDLGCGYGAVGIVAATLNPNLKV
ncbi:MAG: methyltransferase, partial [Candidatus Bathyarchaeota archaeon]